MIGQELQLLKALLNMFQEVNSIPSDSYFTIQFNDALKRAKGEA